MSNIASRPCTGVPAGVRVSSEAFDFQRFDLYRVALEFQKMVPQLVPRRGYAALCDLIRVTQMLAKLVLRMQG